MAEHRPSKRRRSRNPRLHARAQRHAESEAAPPEPVKVPDHPLIPRGAPAMITTSADLAALIERIRARGRFAFDTEFIGELSYFPKLCLVQVAMADEIAIVDPLAEVDLTPFWQLIADPHVETIVHAGAQDLEPVVRLLDAQPANIFDTQVCAGFAGLPYPLSLQKLVRQIVRVKLGKAQTFTRWDVRPLSARHLGYAADDVRFLPLIHERLSAQLADCGHTDLAAAECAAMAARDNFVFDADRQVQRVARSDNIAPRQKAILRALVQWRDTQARRRDVPPRSMLKDEVLNRIARDPAEDTAALNRVRDMPTPVVRSHGEEILQLVRDAIETAPGGRGRHSANRPEETVEQRVALDQLWTVVAAYSLGRGIDPGLITTRVELTQFLEQAAGGSMPTTLRIVQGWRGTFIGDVLRRVVERRLDLHVTWSDAGLRAAPLAKE